MLTVHVTYPAQPNTSLKMATNMAEICKIKESSAVYSTEIYISACALVGRISHH